MSQHESTPRSVGSRGTRATDGSWGRSPLAAAGRLLPMHDRPSATSATSGGPLTGLQVLEVGGGLAAAYATKLLVDLGARATVIEPAGGCVLRNAPTEPSRGAPIFQYLRSGCSSIIAASAPHEGEQLLALSADTDITIEALAPGRWAEMTGLDTRLPKPPSVVVHVSAFGQTGPRSGRSATSLTLQALAGWPRRLVAPDGSPCFSGGDIDAYGAGVHAAVAALTAWRYARANCSSTEADVAAFECLVGMLPYPTVHAEILAAAGLPAPSVAQPLPGVVRSADGWVGVNPLDQQGWNDLCEVLELPEFRGRLREVLENVSLASEFRSRAGAWFGSHDGDAIVELMQSIRVPATRVLDGYGLLRHPQLRARALFLQQPGSDFVRPRPPWRFSTSPLSAPAEAPLLGESLQASATRPRHQHRSDDESSWGGGRPGLPYSGLKVMDLSAFWAGPIVTMYLAAFGADVVKVESHRRPDPFRYSMSSPELGSDWWERSAVWQAANLGKRGLTLDLSHADGQRIMQRFLARADVLIENFTPRVLGQLGIDLDVARAENPALIVIRLPGFGTDGPWRNHLAWAPTLEQASGLAHVTGSEFGPPLPPGGCADPLGGMHGLLGLQAALEHRDRTGEGQVVEMSQFEALVSTTADQVIAASCGSHLPGRCGNRHPRFAPHGIYRCEGAEEWIALAVQDDEWEALTDVLERPDFFEDPSLALPRQRRERHDELDAVISAWTSRRPATVAEAQLTRAGVTAAAVARAPALRDDEQLRARGYFQAIDRPATGTYGYPGWPMRFSFGPSRAHAHAAPALGEHTEQLLEHVLRLSPDEISHLWEKDVIGDAASGRL